MKKVLKTGARAIAAALTATVICSSASAFVDLGPYGLKSVEDTAVCVSQRMSAAASNDVAHMYWSPTTKINGNCVVPARTMNAVDINNARSTFLTGLSSCVGHQVTNDSDVWVRRVADATAIIAASGVRDNLSGETLLDRFNAGSNTCNPRPNKK